MAQHYRFSFCAWNKDLDYYMPECGDEWITCETDEQALLAAETSIEGKLTRGMRKVNCVIEVVKAKEKTVSIRWVATLMKPKSEFRRPPAPAPDPNATQFYPGVLEPRKK